MNHDIIAPVLLALAVVLVSAKIGGDLAVRAGQPAVLGELFAGIVLGNLPASISPWLSGFKGDPTLDVISRLGVVILLFQVGLESTVSEMLKVGVSSLVVATLGVLAPMLLGWGVGAWLLPQESWHLHLFLGAVLCATSVGITARVFKDLGRLATREARIVLGAAVIDDVQGLVVLAAVASIIASANAGEAVSWMQVVAPLVKAAVFLGASLLLGAYLSPKLFHVASKLRARGVLLATGLSFCFILSSLADGIGLAPIVGAFAAGLILEDVHYKDFEIRGERTLDQLVEPISAFLVPVFFVLMGMRTDLGAFATPGVLGLAAALTVAAIIGKQVCALGVVGGGVDRLTVGIGMIPRGEVGLIFANVGLGLTLHGERVIDSATFSAIVVMVIVTTMITPPALKWSLARAAGRNLSKT